MAFLLQWIDIIWLPLALAVVHKEQRGWALSVIACGIVMMHMQVELIESTGFPRGYLGLLSSEVHNRGLVVYSVFYALYLVLAYYSPGSRGAVFMAASLSVFFMAFFTSTFVMLL